MSCSPYIVESYISAPFTIFDANLAQNLVEEFLDNHKFFLTRSLEEYTTEEWLSGSSSENQVTRKNIAKHSGRSVFLEDNRSIHLSSFAKDNALNLELERPLSADDGLTLKDTFIRLKDYQSAYSVLTNLVSSIHILRCEESEFDVSYSHSKVPFSIFVSIPPRDSFAYELRLIESIIHETLHLFLSLLEQRLPLIEDSARIDTFYSPWRDTERPLSGVIHGMFVFRGIYDLFSANATCKMTKSEQVHIKSRMNEIKEQIDSLREFHKLDGLTNAGRRLSKILSQF